MLPCSQITYGWIIKSPVPPPFWLPRPCCNPYVARHAMNVLHVAIAPPHDEAARPPAWLPEMEGLLAST